MSPPNRGPDHNILINEINTGPYIRNNDESDSVSMSRCPDERGPAERGPAGQGPGSSGPRSSGPKHYRQAATLLKNPTVMDIGDTIVVDISVSLSFGVCVRCCD
jgi:hypothetical protein